MLGSISFSGLAASGNLHLQDTINNPGQLLGSDYRAITTAVPFLLITPDARSAGLGDAGAATSPDPNSAFWNAGKLVFNKKTYGAAMSYTPWLGKIINDMWVFNTSGYYKITREQAVGLSFKYFDLGEIQFNKGPEPTDLLGRYNPREFSIDLTYSRMLSENLGVGITGRYIHSNLTGAFSVSGGTDARPANSVAADVGVYYSKDLMKGARNSNISLGASISNIGAKISYSDNASKDFLPTNLKIGGAYTTELDPHNSLTFILDFNKLMVPSPPERDENGNIISGKDPNRSLLSGMFGSFGDAPDGFSEEIQEFTLSGGLEYWYRDIFAARLGYFNEAKNKGNRKYMTLGAGFRKDAFGFDIAYLVPTNKREHPLAETVRFTLLFTMGEKPQVEESVTD